MVVQMGKMLFAILCIIIAVFLFGCTTQSSAGTDTNGMIVIGVIAPLSGSLAEYGVAFKNGIELANIENPNQKIRYVFEDNKFDPKEAITAFHKLQQIDRASVILNWGTPTSEAIAPLTKDAKIPFIAISTEPPVTLQSEYVIRGGFNQPKDYANVLWNYLRSKGIKRIGIVRTQLVYLNTLYDELQKEMVLGESIELIDTYESDSKDFRAALTKIRDSNYDAVGVFLVSGQISQFYKQAQELGVTMKTFGSDFFESQSEIDGAQGLMNGAVYANTGVTKDFYEKYVNKYGNASQIAFAGAGYDLAKILNTQVNFTDTNSILISIKEVKNFLGVEGNLSYVQTADDKYFLKPTYLKEIVNNSVKVLNGNN